MELISKAVATKGNIGYASDFERNGLFKINLETYECEYLHSFPDENINVTGLHCCAKWVENKIYFIPTAGKNIAVYDVESDEIKTIQIPDANRKYKSGMKFISAVEYSDSLWIIPATYPGVLKLNMTTGELTIINQWVGDDDYMFRRGIVVKDNFFYAANGTDNIVLVFDMSREEGRIQHVGTNNHGTQDMCEFEGFLVLAPRECGAIVKWNPEKNVICEFCDYPEGFSPQKIVFTDVYAYESELIFVPSNSNCGIRLAGEKIIMESEIQWKYKDDNKIEFMFETNEKIYFREIHKDLNSTCFFVERQNNNLTECRFTIINSQTYKDYILKSSIEANEVLKESMFIGLDDWLKTIF